MTNRYPSLLHTANLIPGLERVAERPRPALRGHGARDLFRHALVTGFAACPPARIVARTGLPMSTVCDWATPGKAGPRFFDLGLCPRELVVPVLRRSLAAVEPPPAWAGSLHGLLGALLVSAGQVSVIVGTRRPEDMSPEERRAVRQVLDQEETQIAQLRQMLDAADAADGGGK